MVQLINSCHAAVLNINYLLLGQKDISHSLYGIITYRCFKCELIDAIQHASYLLASERNERDTIRGVQIRAGAVRIYIFIT